MNRNDDTIASMADRIAALESHLSKVESNLKAAQRRGRNAWITSGLILFSAIMLAANPQVQAQFGITLASLNTRLTAVENKTAPLSYNSTTKLLTVTGANVMIIDGTGQTLSNSRLGNLQVGYNELRSGGNIRTGSHNLIVGDLQNYSSSGGLVAGLSNEISGRYASITGGVTNTASGDYASITGGATNTASGDYASVTGGDFNTASGRSSCVSGGRYNSASFSYSSISGGEFNETRGLCSSISGGTYNTASAMWASVTGGGSNTASGIGATVTGGVANLASGSASSILGGYGVTLNLEYKTYPPAP